MRYKLAAVGPGLVDIHIKLPDADFAKMCAVNAIKAGDWREIKHRREFDLILRDLGVSDYEALAVGTVQQATLVAGSSTLSMLAAQPQSMRGDCTYVCAVGAFNGLAGPMARFFEESVKRMGLGCVAKKVEGDNPMGLVVAARSNPEKVLYFYPGIARSTTLDLSGLECEILIIDAYELQAGPLADLLHRTIDSGRYRIALSLGNRSVLQGALLQWIRQHFQNGRIYAVAGNLDEYQALTPETASRYLSREEFGNHPIAKCTAHALLTLGAAGMIASSKGETFFAEAAPLDLSAIVNTSGAGDVAAGIFFGGIVESMPMTSTLNHASKMARAVLQVPSSMVLG